MPPFLLGRNENTGNGSEGGERESRAWPRAGREGIVGSRGAAASRRKRCLREEDDDRMGISVPVSTAHKQREMGN
jgi:hypothetical protein